MLVAYRVTEWLREQRGTRGNQSSQQCRMCFFLCGGNSWVMFFQKNEAMWTNFYQASLVMMIKSAFGGLGDTGKARDSTRSYGYRIRCVPI